ncbi:MAG: thioesterase family protein [Desulfurivibrionaceae bacterium]|nr:thioesterase family protein [Desulfurivibrionaceae bacterium]
MSVKRAMAMLEPIKRCQVRVLYGDTDAGGVVYNATYLRYLEQGRGEFMRECGLPYKHLEERGFVLPLVESYLRYKAPARYDDLLFIETCLADLSRFSCRFHCQVRNGPDNRLLAKGFTHHASISKEEGTLTPLPPDVLAGLAPYVGRE